MESIQKEFLNILSDYQGIIHKVNLIYFRSEIDKQDNFQEVVYQLWKSFLSLNDRNKLASWIYAVAINTSITRIRKDCKINYYDSVPEITYIEPDNHIEHNINYQRLVEALHKLPEIDRSIMLLYLEDYNYEEIAEIVGIKATNVGVKIYRLKNQLQKQLKDR